MHRPDDPVVAVEDPAVGVELAAPLAGADRVHFDGHGPVQREVSDPEPAWFESGELDGHLSVGDRRAGEGGGEGGGEERGRQGATGAITHLSLCTLSGSGKFSPSGVTCLRA